MSDEKSQQQEPTMEEILASIRRIISENDEGDAKADAGDGTAPPTPDAASEEEILELTDVVEDDESSAPDDGSGGDVVMEDAQPATASPEPRSAPGPAADPEPEETPMAEEETEADAAPPQVEKPERRPAEEPLVSAGTAAASTAALGELARALNRDPRAVGNIALGPGNTLEDLVRDMIRPMLKEWLDQNLAPLVERLVRREIERMVRRAEDDL